MKLQEINKISAAEKKPLKIGIILLVLAAALVILIVKIDVLGGIVSSIAATLTPVLAGVVFAFLLNVFVIFFEKFAFLPLNKRLGRIWCKIRRPLSVILSFLIILLLLIFIAFFIIPELINSMSAIAEIAQRKVPEYASTFIGWAEGLMQRYNVQFDLAFLEKFNWDSILTNATQITTDFLTSVFNATVNVASGIITFVVGLIFSVYLLFGKEKLLRGLKATLYAYLPRQAANKVIHVSSMSNQIFFSFIRGQLLESVILGGLCYIGMLLFGFDYALLISSVVTLSALIPIFGAYIGAAIGALVLLLVNPIEALWFLVFLVILQQIESNLIYPRVVGSSIGLPAVWTMFAITFWGGLFGMLGILVGTPVTAIVYQLLKTNVKARLEDKQINPDATESIKPDALIDGNPVPGNSSKQKKKTRG